MTHPPLSLDDLDALAQGGRLRSGAGYELVAGVLLAAPPPSAALLRTVADLAAALDAVARDHAVAVRAPLVFGAHALLRPEVALVRPAWAPAPTRAREGPQRLDGAGVALAVFVGDEEAPLRWRAHRCARGGVREAWTLALGERRGSRWCVPIDGRYTRREALVPGEPVVPEALPGRPVVPWR
jgi:hypothetical protein